MDRDVVNALHLLYQKGQIQRDDLLSRLWCGADSAPDLADLTGEQGDGDVFRLNPYVIKFIKAVEGQLANMPNPDFVFSFPLSQQPRKEGERRPAFVAMPYGADWFLKVRDAIVKSASDAGFDPEVSNDLARPGVIPDQIWHGIRRAEVVVVDISGLNPNVFFELGLACALGKEAILISQDSRQPPFDVSVSRLLRYDPNDLALLRSELGRAFAEVSARYTFDGTQPFF